MTVSPTAIVAVLGGHGVDGVGAAAAAHRRAVALARRAAGHAPTGVRAVGLCASGPTLRHRVHSRPGRVEAGRRHVRLGHAVLSVLVAAVAGVATLQTGELVAGTGSP